MGRAPAPRGTLASGTRESYSRRGTSLPKKRRAVGRCRLRCYTGAMTWGRVAAPAAIARRWRVLAAAGCARKPAQKAEAGQVAGAAAPPRRRRQRRAAARATACSASTASSRRRAACAGPRTRGKKCRGKDDCEGECIGDGAEREVTQPGPPPLGFWIGPLRRAAHHVRLPRVPAAEERAAGAPRPGARADVRRLTASTAPFADPAAVCATLAPLLLDDRRARIDAAAAARLGGLRLVIENLHDPHNGAAVLRSAEAFGVQRVEVIESVEPFRFSSTVTQGCEKWLDVVRHPTLAAAVAALRADGFAIYAAVPGADGDRRGPRLRPPRRGDDRQRARRPERRGDRRRRRPSSASRWRG